MLQFLRSPKSNVLISLFVSILVTLFVGYIVVKVSLDVDQSLNFVQEGLERTVDSISPQQASNLLPIYLEHTEAKYQLVKTKVDFLFELLVCLCLNLIISFALISRHLISKGASSQDT